MIVSPLAKESTANKTEAAKMIFVCVLVIDNAPVSLTANLPITAPEAVWAATLATIPKMKEET